MKKPLWIIVDGGEIFEGHQRHWADTFFSNATEEQIRNFLDRKGPGQETFEIREMTDEELAKYPEALEFQAWLIAEYGEC